jgi:hypothetical protein
VNFLLRFIASVALIVAFYAALMPRRPRTGPGASAAARARQLRTPLVRLATAVGISTRAERLAARSDAGAVGEQRTAQLLAPLSGEGWAVLHDRALPRGNANLDHLLISPRGAVILPDSKLWSARYRLRVTDSRLLHGAWDVTDRLDGLRYEAHAVGRHLGLVVTPLVVVHGAPVDGGELDLDGLRIIPAGRLADVLRDLDRDHPRRNPVAIAARAARLFPPYLERTL